MRLRLILRDREYRRAMAEMLANSEKDVYVELPGEKPFEGMDSKTLIVTDYSPEDFSAALPDNIRKRTVFLTTRTDMLAADNNMDGVYLFKYDSISNIIAELAQYYFKLTGEATRHSGFARMFCVCSDSDRVDSADYCRIISRQIKYRRNSRIIIIPFGYINEYGTPGVTDSVAFSRFMYYLEEGKPYAEDAFIYEDEYGIEYIRMPIGINPISYLSEIEVNKMINTLACNFDVILCDVCTNYSGSSIELLRNAENVFLVKSYVEDYLMKELSKVKDYKSIIPVDIRNGFEATELLIDDSICELFDIEGSK